MRHGMNHRGPFMDAAGEGGGAAPVTLTAKQVDELSANSAQLKKIAAQVETFDGRLTLTADAVAESTRIVNASATAMEEARKAMPQAGVQPAASGLSSRTSLKTALTRREVVSAGDGPRLYQPTITMNPEARATEMGETLTDFEAEGMKLMGDLKGIHENHMAMAGPAGEEYRRNPSEGLKRHAPELCDRMEKLSVHWGGDATDGAEWQTTLFSSVWVDHFTLAAMVQTQFQGTQRVNIPQGSEGFSHPVDLTGTTFATISNTAGSQRAHVTAMNPISPGQPDSGKATHVVALTRGIVNMNEEWVQDSIGDQVSHARRVLSRDGALAWDEMLLNGQQTTDDTSHDGTGASSAANGSYNGLRFLCHDGGLSNSHESDHGGGKLTVAALLADREKMGKFGVNPRDLVHFVDPVNYLALVHDDAVKTFDVFGSLFTLRTGELANLDGIALIPTDQMLTTMNAGGDVDTSTSTLTGSLTVNTTRGFVGQKGGVELRFVPNAAEYQMQLVAFLRTSFAAAIPDTTDEWIRYRFNIATT